VLRGDKNRVTVRPLNDQGSIAEIVIPWQERAPLEGQSDLTGDRVDIGVFANNTKYWSAPAFVSLLFPGNEKRVYRPDGQIAELDYDNPNFRQRFTDPLLFPVHEWRDVYVYDGSGRQLGWTRYRGVVISHFTRDGARVIESDALGRALKAERVNYQIRRESDGRLKVLEVPTGVFVSYSYMGNDDRFGTPTLINGG
jgi:hypothetical protein